MRIYSSIEGGDAFIPIWAIGGGHVILSFQGAMFAFVFSQVRPSPIYYHDYYYLSSRSLLCS
jgi:hypothetical protein